MKTIGFKQDRVLLPLYILVVVGIFATILFFPLVIIGIALGGIFFLAAAVSYLVLRAILGMPSFFDDDYE